MSDLDKENLEASQSYLHKPVSVIFGQEAVAPKADQAAPAPAQIVSGKPAVRLGGMGNLRDLILKAVLGACVLLMALFFVQGQTEAKKRLVSEKQLKQTQSEMESIVMSLATLKASAKESEDVQSRYEELKVNAANLDQKLRNISSEKTGLEATVQQKDQKITELINKLAAFEQAKVDLEGSLGREKSLPMQKMAEQPTLLQAASPGTSVSSRQGKILIVKPVSRMAVVNLGSKDGVKPGAVFEIYSPSNDYVAKLIIDEVEDTIAIGKISPEAASRKVKESYSAELQ